MKLSNFKRFNSERFLINLFCLLVLGECFSQKSLESEYVYMVDAVNDLSNSAVLVYTPLKFGTGTLFIVPFNDSTETGSTFLLTALHVLNKKVDSTGLVLERFDTISAMFNLKTGGTESKRYAKIKYYPEYDVALFKAIERKRPFSEYKTVVFSTNYITSFKALKKGQDAYIFGFPDGIGVSSSHLNSVTQSGIVALVDTSQSLALLDVHINTGNSGCPVYVVENSGKISLMGLIFQYQGSQDDNVFRKSIGALAPANAGLSKVRLIYPILEDLKGLLRK